MAYVGNSGAGSYNPCNSSHSSGTHGDLLQGPPFAQQGYGGQGHSPPFAQQGYGGQGHSRPTGPSLLDVVEEAYKHCWPSYYPDAAYDPNNTVIELARTFYNFFQSPIGLRFHQDVDWENEDNAGIGTAGGAAGTVIYFNYADLRSANPFGDLDSALHHTPEEVMRAMGLSLCGVKFSALYSKHQAAGLSSDQFLVYQAKVTVRLQEVDPITALRATQSHVLSGKFVAVKGNVVRVSPVRPLVLRVDFECGRCFARFNVAFEDGKFEYPVSCKGGSAGCKAKAFTLLHDSATTVDWQRVKIQALDSDPSDDPGRMPATLEVELTEDLCDSCVPGDIVCIAGIVKTMSVEAAAGRSVRGAAGAASSAVSVTYLDARSVTAQRVSERLAAASSLIGRSAAAAANAAAVASASYYSQKDLALIARIKMHRDPFALVIASTCPNIFGMEMVKAGMLMAVFGGTPRSVGGSASSGAAAAAAIPMVLMPPGAVLTSFSSSSSSSSSSSAAASAAAVAPASPSSAPAPPPSSLPSEKKVVPIRCDPHVLVVGDPGMGKSAMLKSIHDLSPRGVYVSGNATSTSGLTATVVRDQQTGDHGLEAGALVLGDQGICCIDEFDKLKSEHDALLEAMEQQSVSIAKAGIVSTLSARTSVIAAANPVGGHYDKGKTINENLKMSGALLSRFDLVFILKDTPDLVRDRQLSDHVLSMHQANSSNNGRLQQQRQVPATPSSSSSSWNERQVAATQAGHARNQAFSEAIDRRGPLASEVATRSKRDAIMEQSNGGAGAGGAGGGGSSSAHMDRVPLETRLRRSVAAIPLQELLPKNLLRKYVAYAKKHCFPALLPEAAVILHDFYLTLRKAGGPTGDTTPITTRQLESLIRLSEARAKMELRDYVTEDDARDVVEMMRESVFEAVTDDLGNIQMSRAGGVSNVKAVRIFCEHLKKVVANRKASMTGSSVTGDERLFDEEDLKRYHSLLQFDMGFKDLLDKMNEHSFLLKAAHLGAKKWKLAQA
jgi:DNA helicase MCM8